MKLIVGNHNVIPMSGATIEVFPDNDYSLISDELASNFDSGKWSFSSSNVTIGTDPFSVTYGALSGSLELVHANGFNNEDVVFFECGFKFAQQAAMAVQQETFTFYIDDDIQINISFRISDGGNNIVYTADDLNGNSHAGNVVWNGVHSTLRIYLFSSKIACYYLEDAEYKLLFLGDWAPTNSIQYNPRLYTSGSGSSGVVTFKPFVCGPLIEGIECNNDIDAPLVESSGADRFRYSVLPVLPGNVVVSVMDQSLTESFNLVVSNHWVNDGEHRFVFSQVEKFYQEGGDIFLCPTQGSPSSANKSSTKVANRCFDDGSSLTTDGVDISACKYGRFSTLENRRTLPEFTVNEYGCNFDFIRSYQDPSFKLSDTLKRMRVLRSKVLNDGKIVYYGIFGDEDASMNLSFSVSYDWSADQDLNPGLDIDGYVWQIVNENGDLIQESFNSFGSPINISNYLDAGNIPPTNLAFAPGRYAFKVHSVGEKTTEFGSNDPTKQGGKIYGNVYQGATTADPLMATGMAEAQELPWIPAGTTLEEEGECWIRFEVAQRRGKLVAFIVDPSAGTVTRHESAIDASLKTKSVALIETSDKIVIFYESGDNDVWHQDRKGYASYVELDVVTGFQTPRNLHLPANGYIHAFDMVVDNDDLLIFASYSDDDVYRYRNSKKRSNSFTPIGENGVYIFKTPLVNYQWVLDETVAQYESTILDASSFNSLFWPICDRIGHSFPEDSVTRVKWFMPDQIRVDYAKELGIFILACTDMISRWGMLWAGRGLGFDELGIPFHFNAWNVKPTVVGTNSHSNTGIDSFSATMAHDGMVYTVATKNDLMEFAINDPYAYFANIGAIATPSLENDDILMYEPPFKFEAYPLLSFDNEDAGNNFLQTSVSTHFHYIDLCIASPEYGYAPIVYKNSYYDKLPFEISADNMWIPELENNSQAYVATNHLFSEEDVRLQNMNLVESSIEATLDTNTCYRYRYDEATIGYRFHTRISLSGALTENAIFYALAFKRPMLWAYEARMLLDGSVATCQVFDSGVWTTVGTIADVTTDVYDLYILIQDLGANSEKARVAFVAKRFDDVNGDVFRMDFQQGLEEIVVYNGFTGQATVVEETVFGVKFEANGVADRVEYAYVNQLDYALLKQDTGMYREFPEGGEVLYYDESLDGERFRLFNDSLIFDHKNGMPDFCFKSNKTSQTTVEFHWNNGFLFKLSGDVVYGGDSWEIKRQLSNDPDAILSKNIAGRWVSEDDASDIVIYADANDSGLDKFYVDTFMLKCANFKSFQIVYKDLAGNPWQLHSTHGLNVYRVTHDSLTIDGNSIVVEKDGMLFFTNELSSKTRYYSQDGNSMSKITSNRGSMVVAEKNPVDSPTYALADGYIYNTQKIVSLSEVIEARFVGIRLLAHDTYQDYFMLDSLDFGKQMMLPVEHSPDNNGEESLEYKFDYDLVELSQPIRLRNEEVKTDIDVNLTTADPEASVKMLSITQQSNLRRRPFWFAKNISDEFGKFHLVFINGEPTLDVIVDERVAGDYIYSIKMTLTSVGECE